MKKNMKSSSILLGGLFLLGRFAAVPRRHRTMRLTSIRSSVRADMGIPIPER